MKRFFAKRYMPIRASVLLLIGAVAILAARASHLRFQQPPVRVAPAPELVGRSWINTAVPISLASRRGKVTMVEFWTFACSNCQANLPAYERIQQRFSPQAFTIVSVHTPELPQERKKANVVRFVQDHGITYPVLLDRDYSNWRRWKQQDWPAIYLVDKQGNVRYKWIGELNYLGTNGEEKLNEEIGRLLRE